MSTIQMVLQFAAEHWGIVGQVGAYVFFLVPAMTAFLECGEAIVTLTSGTADDAVVGRLRAAWDKAMPYLEVIPHANWPIGAGVVKVVTMAVKACKGVVAFVKAMKE